MLDKFKKILPSDNQKGFTLVELIVTLFVVMAVLEVFAFATSSVSATSLLRDNLIAANLVQEGLEVTRNIRDKDWFAGSAFGTSLPNGSWRVQWDSVQLISLGANPRLKKDASSGLFSYDSGTETVFQRTITVSQVSANEISITSAVNWNYRGDDKSLSAETHLFNWYRP